MLRLKCLFISRPPGVWEPSVRRCHSFAAARINSDQGYAIVLAAKTQCNWSAGRHWPRSKDWQLAMQRVNRQLAVWCWLLALLRTCVRTWRWAHFRVGFNARVKSVELPSWSGLLGPSIGRPYVKADLIQWMELRGGLIVLTSFRHAVLLIIIIYY